jgi:hypothetical protein
LGKLDGILQTDSYSGYDRFGGRFTCAARTALAAVSGVSTSDGLPRLTSGPCVTEIFTDLCTGRVTFSNSGTEAIGNIHYRTYYLSETGIRHENSIIDAVIEKLIQPGETRTIELEKFLVPNDANQAGIYFISCEQLPQFTKQTERKQADRIADAGLQVHVYHDAKSWRRDHPPTQEEIDAEKKLQAAWDRLTPIQRKNLRADELAWIKAKDNTVMGFDRIRMIKDRTEVLTNLGERFSK